MLQLENWEMRTNMHNSDGTGAKSTAMINLVKSSKVSIHSKSRRLTDLTICAQARGIPIDQIGAQAHLVVGTLPTDIQKNWQSFADLGVYVA